MLVVMDGGEMGPAESMVKNVRGVMSRGNVDVLANGSRVAFDIEHVSQCLIGVNLSGPSCVNFLDMASFIVALLMWASR